MNHRSRRYLFIQYEDLKHIKFKKLEKVSDKLFIFVKATETAIPLPLVKEMQGMGKAIKWLVLDNAESKTLYHHISFLMGKLHEKLHNDIEFAVLTDDVELDSLIAFINADGRSCIRVKRSKANDSSSSSASMGAEILNSAINNSPETNSDLDNVIYNSSNPILHVEVDNELIDQTARETVKRLLRSGNRPAEVSTLKSYILLHNQELSHRGYLDKIISRMEEMNNIAIKNQEVQYNF